MKTDILAAKEARFLQNCELAKASPVITIGLNLPGGAERYPFAGALLERGSSSVKEALRSGRIELASETTHSDATGLVWTGVVRGNADRVALKKRMAQLEEGDASGRLWDIDVLSVDGSPIDRAAIGELPRRCYVCEEPAHECRLAGRHSLAELVRSAEALWLRHIEDEVASVSIAASLLEAATAPSPGLVSPISMGSHEDMNYLSFLLSTSAIAPGFGRLARHGAHAALERITPESLPALMPRLRATGVEMERQMSGSVHANTHRGLIFTLGTATAAAAYAWSRKSLRGDPSRPTPDEVCSLVAFLTRGITEQDRNSAPAGTVSSRGRELMLETGLRGVRGEVEDGFPTVLRFGYPAFQEALSQATLADALVHALIALIAHTEDTALAGRHSPEVLFNYVRPAALHALELGSVFTPAGKLEIVRLEEDFTARRLNPGGSADLLAVTAALFMWRNGSFPRAAITGISI